MAYPPGTESVTFDYTLADAAAAACTKAARALNDATGRRHDLAAAAQREWRGQYRNRFDSHMESIESEAREIEAQLRQLAGAILGAADAARQENQHRSDQRAQYRLDHPDEFAPIPMGGPR